MAQTEEESRRLAEELTNATTALSQFSGMLYGQSAEQLKATQADKDAKDAAALFAAKMNAASDAAKALANTFVNYQKEVYKGASANKAAASSIEAFGDAVQAAGILLSLFMPGGALIKGVRIGLAMLAGDLVKSAKVIAEQTDEVYKAYQEMAKVGAAGAGGMQDVFDSLQRVGLGTEKFAEYTKLVGENATDLAMFGGSVNKGRKIFDSTMASFSTNQRVEMEMMGLNRTAQAEATMAYIKQQRLLTSGTKAQMDTSSNAVEKYIKETDALTRITGANREEQQKILDEAMAEDMFGSFLDNMRSQGEEGVKKAEQIQNAIIMQQKMYGTQSAKGLRDSLTGFLGTSKENEKFFMTYGEGGQELVSVLRDVNATNADMYAAMKSQAKSGKELNEAMAGVTGMGVAGDVFISYKERRLAEQNFNKDLGKLFAEVGVERAKQLADAMTKKAAEAENNVRETQLKQQKAINLAMPGYIDTSLAASKANLALAEAALAAAEALFGLAGKKKDTNITGKKLAEASGKNAAANEAKSGRIGPEEAKAVLENGSERDIKDFGGREALEKIAGSAPAKPPTAPSRGRGTPPAPTKGKGASPPAAAGGGGAASSSAPAGSTPAAAPAAGGNDLGAPPPADKPVPKNPTGANNEVQMGQEVRVGNEIRKGGTVSWRTNNPGNVSYGGLSKKYGAIGTWKKLDGDAQQRSTGIAIMPSLDAGDELKMGLWRRPMYIDKTIDQGVAQWTGSTGLGSGYAKDLAAAAGASIDTVIGQLSDSQLKSMVTKQRVWEGFKTGQTIQAADGGMFSGPKSGYSATLHGDEAVIPLKNGAVPVAMPKDFVEGMSKYNLLTKMLTDKFTENNTSASAKQELEDIKSRAMTGAGPGAEAMLTAFNQLGAELKAQGEANRSLFEAMLRGQTTSNDIQNKMLRYTQN